jgi:hypothetical protein
LKREREKEVRIIISKKSTSASDLQLRKGDHKLRAPEEIWKCILL